MLSEDQTGLIISDNPVIKLTFLLNQARCRLELGSSVVSDSQWRQSKFTSFFGGRDFVHHREGAKLRPEDLEFGAT